MIWHKLRAHLTGRVRCSSILPDLKQFAAVVATLFVQSSGIIVGVFDQVMMFAFLIDSTTVLLMILWHSREENMFLLFLQVFYGLRKARADHQQFVTWYILWRSF